MKRLVSVCLLMLCLSFPVFGGHVLQGGRYCDCSDPNHGLMGLTVESEAEIKHGSTPNDAVSELDLLIDVLLMLIRL